MPEGQNYGVNYNQVPPQPAPGRIDDFKSQLPAHPSPTVGLKLPPKPDSNLPDTSPSQPVPIVKMLSTRGMEYAMMSVSLWIAAVALAWILLNLANGSRSFNFLVVPTSALTVSLPIYMLFFFRLKRAEISTPDLKLDPSRRRWSQLTQFLAYIASLVNLIIFVYKILARYGSNKGSYSSIGRSALDASVILAITLSLVAYYWIDEHRLSRG